MYTYLIVLSFFIMYSTDGGEFLYHTKSHLTKLVSFFYLMLVISFFNIKFWHLMLLFFIWDYYFIINLGIYLWNKSLRLTKMDEFIFFSSYNHQN